MYNYESKRGIWKMKKLFNDVFCSSPQSTSPTNTYGFVSIINHPDLVTYLDDDFNFESTVRLLSFRDQLHIHSNKSKTAKQKLLITKLFTTLILNYFVQRNDNSDFNPWKQLNFTYNEFGKPFLEYPNAHIHFNSSSSNDIISLVVSISDAVGIDLSHSRQDSISSLDFMNQFDDMFHPIEKVNLMQIDDINKRYIAFNQLWTLKESFTKYIGSGLNIDLKQIGFDFKYHTNLKNPIRMRGVNLIEELNIDWQHDISITIEDNLRSSQLINLKKGNYYMKSGCLTFNDVELPVLISIIHQNKNCNLKCFNIDFYKALLLY